MNQGLTRKPVLHSPSGVLHLPRRFRKVEECTSRNADCSASFHMKQEESGKGSSLLNGESAQLGQASALLSLVSNPQSRGAHFSGEADACPLLVLSRGASRRAPARPRRSDCTKPLTEMPRFNPSRAHFRREVGT